MTSGGLDQLFTEILKARSRVYRAGSATPLQRLYIPSIDAEIYIKREDLSPIHAYKWRGAYNCTSVLTESTGAQSVVAASAGNHAQGVALAARMLGIQAKIYMPLSTPQMKQNAVRLHGQGHVEIVLVGDAYDQANEAAKDYAAQHNLPYVHPFDDIYTIAGQATIADEIVLSGEGPFDYAFLQIGGGGMAAGVSSWLKLHHPETKMIGVEGVGQASMRASLSHGEPVNLDEVDTFCDGTAVRRPGAMTFSVCRTTLDEMVTVSNEEVCSAMQKLWESRRIIPEPSGAMGLAGLVRYAADHPELVRGKKLLCVLSGANMDFGKLALISSRSAVGGNSRRYFRFRIDERKGSLLDLLDRIFADVNVTEFQYGKTSEGEGFPVIAFDAGADRLAALEDSLRTRKIPFQDVTDAPDIRFRVIHYDSALFHDPVFLLVNFPERKGALREFMRQVSGIANLCYFNYAYTGEVIGRALMGFEFRSRDDHAAFHNLLRETSVDCRVLSDEAARRMMGGA